MNRLGEACAPRLLCTAVRMFRALSLLALISVVVATPNVPRTLLLSRQLSGTDSSDCSDVCLTVSDTLQVY